jgi:hypothetical protein
VNSFVFQKGSEPEITPLSLDFDYGDFSKPSKDLEHFNERQVELIEKLFEKKKSITLMVIDAVAFHSEDFSRLWKKFVEINQGHESKASRMLRYFIAERNYKKKKEMESN